MTEEKEEILKAIEKVFESGTLVFGDNLKNFEDKFAKYCNSQYGIGVGNCTDAIRIALEALGIGKGDEVITVSNTAIPTVSAIVQSGATPVFVDINEKDYLLDVNKIEDVITNKTKCILPVHLFVDNEIQIRLPSVEFHQISPPLFSDLRKQGGGLFGYGPKSPKKFAPSARFY